MAQQKQLCCKAAIIIFLIGLSNPSWAAIDVPLADPFFVIDGQPTTVTISAYIPDYNLISSSVNLLRLDSKGNVTANLGSLNDNGINGDTSAGDRLFAISTNLTASGDNVIRLRITAALKGVLRRITAGCEIAVLRIAPIYDNSQYRQAVDSVFENLLDAGNSVAILLDTSTSLEQFYGSLNAITNDLLSVCGTLESIYRRETHSPSNYPKWADYAPIMNSLVRASRKPNEERDIFVNGRYPCADPRVEEFVRWGVEMWSLDESEFCDPGDPAQKELREGIAGHYQNSNPGSGLKDMLEASRKIALKQIIGQFTNLVGQGLGGIFELGPLSLKGINFVIDKVVDILLFDGTDPMLLVAEIGGTETLDLPVGSHDIIATFSENVERAIVRNIPVSSASNFAAIVSPGDIRDYSSRLVATGITQCFDNTQVIECPCPGQPFCGQDGQHVTNPMSFTDNGDGTISDDVTGLMWQKEDDNQRRYWYDAQSYCTNLTLAGYHDWRLPNLYELHSIVDYGRGDVLIDPAYFPGTDWWYWSSDYKYADGNTYACRIHFNGGVIECHDIAYRPSLFTRCVRGEPMGQSLTDNGNGTVTDNLTGLMWQQTDDDQKRAWEGALEYCQNLSLAGYTDWRLPNIKELLHTGSYPTYSGIDANYFRNITTYPGSLSKGYWSSSSCVASPSYAYYFYGSLYEMGKNVSSYVRCVR